MIRHVNPSLDKCLVMHYKQDGQEVEDMAGVKRVCWGKRPLQPCVVYFLSKCVHQNRNVAPTDVMMDIKSL